MKYLTRPKAQNTQSDHSSESSEFKNDSNLAFKLELWSDVIHT